MIDVPDFQLTQEELDKIKKGAAEETEKEYLEKLGEEHKKSTVLSEENILQIFP